MTRPQGVDRNARPTKRERRQLEKLKGATRLTAVGGRPSRRTRNQWAA